MEALTTSHLMVNRAKPGWVKRLYAVLLLGVAAKLLWDILNP